MPKEQPNNVGRIALKQQAGKLRYLFPVSGRKVSVGLKIGLDKNPLAQI